MSEVMKVKFWGVRGSFPVAGPEVNRYGGNTSCVEVRADDGTLIIIDAGTGIRNLGGALMGSEFGKGQGKAYIFFSHTHWDHIQGFPFFTPVYIKGNEFTIYSRGRRKRTLEDTFSRQFAGSAGNTYFPVPFGDLASTFHFRMLREGNRFKIGEVGVHTERLNHPTIALGYRIEADGACVVYLSDTAPYRDMLLGEEYATEEFERDPKKIQEMKELEAKMIDLAHGADLLIYDTMYTSEEYKRFPHFGHSTPDDAIKVSLEANAKSIVLFHHLPERSDQEIDEITDSYRDKAEKEKLELSSAYEGLEIRL